MAGPPNYTGTQSNLTGIPSLLISSLQQVKDPVVQTALYQIQQWANSFFTWQYGGVAENYTTGGFVGIFPKPFASELSALVITPSDLSNASQAQIVLASTTGFTVRLYTPTGTQVANASPISFYYIAVGH
jgi:hypothetical protein